MKKDLQDIILNSIPKKYHKKVRFVIDEYDTIHETSSFRFSLLIILICIGIMLLHILRVLIGG